MTKLNKKPYKRIQPVLKNPNRTCVICDKDYKAVAPLQKTCSIECRKTKNKKLQKEFKLRNPDKQKEYIKNAIKKNPNLWREKAEKERIEILEALGCKCVVCGNNNRYHLHVDYIPTMLGTGYRHPRHKKWVMDNIKDFRLLCANHHYELTLTGKIEGTDIIQERYNDKFIEK